MRDSVGVMLQEVEEKAPILKQQREDYERCLENVDLLTQQLNTAVQVPAHCRPGTCTLPSRYLNAAVQVPQRCRPGTAMLPSRYLNAAVQVPQRCCPGTSTLPSRYLHTAVQVPPHCRPGTSTLPSSYLYAAVQVPPRCWTGTSTLPSSLLWRKGRRVVLMLVLIDCRKPTSDRCRWMRCLGSTGRRRERTAVSSSRRSTSVRRYTDSFQARSCSLI